MKHIYLHINILFCLCFILLFSCKKEIEYEGIKGDLKGKVTLNDREVTITNYSNISVTVEGSVPLLTTTTNEKGEFLIKDLETGIYDIVFSKEGFGTFKRVSYQFIGGNIATNLGVHTLHKLPDVRITSLKVDTVRMGSYYVYASVSGVIEDPKTNYILRYYVSDDPGVSYLNYQATELIFTNYYSTEFFYTLSNAFLSRIPKSKKLYLIIYPSSSSSNYYLDISTGKQIYDINPDRGSSVVSFTNPVNFNID